MTPMIQWPCPTPASLLMALVAVLSRVFTAVAIAGNDATGMHRVWIASAVLQRHLHTDAGRRFLVGRRCVELGCGMATTSISAVRLGAAQMVATDGTPATVEVARANAERNLTPEELARFTAAQYLWGESPPTGIAELPAFTFDTVLVSDAIYEAGQPENLVKGIREVCAPGCDVLISYDASRWKDGIDMVCEGLQQLGFTITRNLDVDTTEVGSYASKDDLQPFVDGFRGPKGMQTGFGGDSIDGKHIELVQAHLSGGVKQAASRHNQEL
eukprot:COSAG01_NODE_932_length_12651_cov_50.381741_5_plen_271_part_00